MQWRILRVISNIISRIWATDTTDQRANRLHEGDKYLEAYSQHTDLRVETDPKLAAGGMWEEIGQIQYQFLISKGLQPHHKLLDLGCGTLRGGRHFIRYLNTENYYGIDISSKAIAYAKQLVEQEGLSQKRPHLEVSENKDLKFQELSGMTFDYILAQSVFTHLKPDHIKECLENIRHIMRATSLFYFTYFDSQKYRQASLESFCYPFSFFESLAVQYGLQLQDCSKEYNHPRGQLMVELTKKE